jgi:repressor LexA
VRRAFEVLSGSERIGVPSHLLDGRPGDHYVLRVVGDSMLEEGIRDGDYVICRRGAAEPGDCAVCLVGDDATLKFWFPEGDTVRLEPASSALKPIRIPAKDVTAQGVVVGLMRQFKRRVGSECPSL